MDKDFTQAQRHVLWDMLNNHPKPTPTNYLIIWFYTDKSYAESISGGIQRNFALDIRHKTLRSMRCLERMEYVDCKIMTENAFNQSSNEKIFWKLTRKGLDKAVEISSEFVNEKRPIIRERPHQLTKLNS